MINKHHIILSALLLFSALNLFIAPRSLADEPKVIIFVGEMTYNQDHPCEPILHCVETPACVATQTSSNAPCPVVIAFTDDIGQVAVMIENHTTGMYEQELTNSAQGLAVYQVSGTPGIYSVTVTRADGHSYSELFAIQ